MAHGRPVVAAGGRPPRAGGGTGRATFRPSVPLVAAGAGRQPLCRGRLDPARPHGARAARRHVPPARNGVRPPAPGRPLERATRRGAHGRGAEAQLRARGPHAALRLRRRRPSLGLLCPARRSRRAGRHGRLHRARHGADLRPGASARHALPARPPHGTRAARGVCSRQRAQRPRRDARAQQALPQHGACPGAWRRGLAALRQAHVRLPR